MLPQPVSMLHAMPCSGAAVPFLYAPDMCRVMFLPETSVTSSFIQSVWFASGIGEDPTTVMLPYFTHCPVVTPGL